MLLPPDLRDWLPEDDLAWLVIEVVDRLDLSALMRRYRQGGTGREAYDPAMLTALVIYGFCRGIRSSRALERACVTDVACRVITAQQRPDHTTISRFRVAHAAALAGLFGQVLTICHAAGLGRVGVVSIDGTKVMANASPRKNHSEERLQRLAADLVAQAQRVDEAEDAEFGDAHGDELPEDLAPGPDRARRIQAALDKLKEERAERVAADVAEAAPRVERAKRSAEHARQVVSARHGARPRRANRMPVEEHKSVRDADAKVAAAEAAVAQAVAGQGPKAKAPSRCNLTDPDSRLMRAPNRGYLQAYNAQIGVSDDHLIVATDVTTDANDVRCFVPMMNLTSANVTAHLPGKTIGTVLADNGYFTREAVTAPGPDRLIATGRDPAKPAKDPVLQAMVDRLQLDSPGRVIYKRRAATVEPVIGHLKDPLGLRRFARRGIQAARHELALAAIAHNIRRLATI
jgi:transposase